MSSQLTAAYIAIGYITQNREIFIAVQEHYAQGQLDLVGNMVHYAEYLDALAEAGMTAAGAPGVFDYEVTEAFGPWFSTEVLKLEPGHVPETVDVCIQLRAMCKRFFLKSWDEPTGDQCAALSDALHAVPMPLPYGSAA